MKTRVCLKYFLNDCRCQFLQFSTQRNTEVWINKGIAKSSKKKQRLYVKFLQNRIHKNEEAYKTNKNLFETIKKRSKKKIFSEKLKKVKGDARKTCSAMKKVLEKVHHKILNSVN